MGKLGEMNGYIRMTLNTEGIRGDLVRSDDDWKEWKESSLSRHCESGP